MDSDQKKKTAAMLVMDSCAFMAVSSAVEFCKQMKTVAGVSTDSVVKEMQTFCDAVTDGIESSVKELCE